MINFFKLFSQKKISPHSFEKTENYYFLNQLLPGQEAIIIEFRGKKGHHCHMKDMGLNEGKIVKVLRNQGGGALLVKVDEIQIAMGQCLASKIKVELINLSELEE